jgi:dTDP-4-amino-4,6-dideoxygalactose transaminase
VRSAERDALQQRLGTAGIGTLIHYPIAPHMQDAYTRIGIAADALPLARQLATEVLSLPIGPQLDIGHVHTINAQLKTSE